MLRTEDVSDNVSVAWVHGTDVSYSWFASFLGMVQYDLGASQRITRGGYLGVRYAAGGLIEARNKAVEAFLANRRSDWLFWIDTDMGFMPDTVDRLLEAADPVERPVMGGLCFVNREVGVDGRGGFRTVPSPTTYRWVRNPDGTTGFAQMLDYPRDEVCQVEGTGAACVLIHRSVLETMADKLGPNWYGLIANPATGGAFSEDLSFCIRCAEIDVPIHVHTGVKTTHHKPIWLSEEHYDLHLIAGSEMNGVRVNDLAPKPNRAQRRAAAKK